MTSNRWINYQQFIQTLEKPLLSIASNLISGRRKLTLPEQLARKETTFAGLADTAGTQSTAALLAENRLDQKRMDELPSAPP